MPALNRSAGVWDVSSRLCGTAKDDEEFWRLDAAALVREGTDTIADLIVHRLGKYGFHQGVQKIAPPVVSNVPQIPCCSRL